MRHVWGRSPRIAISIGTIAGSLFSIAGGAVAAAPAAVAADAAPKPPADVWTRVTGNVGDIGELSFARNGADVLHVLWVAGHASSHYLIMDTPIGPNGQVGTPGTVAGPLPAPSQPGEVATSHGLEAIWYDTLQAEVRDATRPSVGGGWAPQVVPLLSGVTLGGNVTAAANGNGAPLFAFLGCGGFCIDRLGNAQVAIPMAQCCFYVPGVAVDGGSGRYWLGYGALRGLQDSGVYVQALSSNGHPDGAATRLADTSNRGVNAVPAQQVALTGRGAGHPGVFAAWQGTEQSNLTWDVFVQRLGGGAATVLGADPSTSPVAIAAGPNGRVWVVWEEMKPFGGGYLYYRRSGPGGVSFGPTGAIALPNSFQGHYNLYASAQAGRLDVLGLWGPTFAYYEHQIVVHLGLTASLRGYHVEFAVTDQGSPVAGATVAFCGSHLTTGPSGTATFTVRATGVKTPVEASASAPSYAATAISVAAACGSPPVE